MPGEPVLPDPDLVAKETEGEQAVLLGRRADLLVHKVSAPHKESGGLFKELIEVGVARRAEC